jgi:hypothetical protein
MSLSLLTGREYTQPTGPKAIEPKTKNGHQHPESQCASSPTIGGTADDCANQADNDLRRKTTVHDHSYATRRHATS